MKNKLLILILLTQSLMGMEISISIENQTLSLIENSKTIKIYKISSSKYGEGSEENSFKTPLGLHEIKELIGADEALGTRFIGRVPSEIYPIYSSEKIKVDDDVVQSRIMWLDGLEQGINKGEGIDSYSRYIYIHGTPEEWLLGKKGSKGCIRMANKDVIELFDYVQKGTLVRINK